MGENILQPVDESQLEDKRDKIAENVFIELDIVKKIFLDNFGEDRIYEDIDFVHANIAVLLSLHINTHNLYDIKINEFRIPDSPYFDVNGKPSDMPSMLKPMDKITYICNLLKNAKLGLMELHRSKYFPEELNNALLVDIDIVFRLIATKIDEILLRCNTILNKI